MYKKFRKNFEFENSTVRQNNSLNGLMTKKYK